MEKNNIIGKLFTFAGYAIITVIAFSFIHLEVTIKHHTPDHLNHYVYSSYDGFRIKS